MKFNDFYEKKGLDKNFMKYSEGRFFRLLDKYCYGYDKQLKILTEEERNEFKYNKEKEIPITYFPNSDNANEMIVREIPFTSLCEHHFMPMEGTIWIAYIPTDKILGLNKIDRIAKYYCGKLQQQERIVTNIADWLVNNVSPNAMVVCKGRHYCAIMQGDNGDFITSAIRGVFKEHPNAREEALKLMKI